MNSSRNSSRDFIRNYPRNSFKKSSTIFSRNSSRSSYPEGSFGEILGLFSGGIPGLIPGGISSSISREILGQNPGETLTGVYGRMPGEDFTKDCSSNFYMDFSLQFPPRKLYSRDLFKTSSSVQKFYHKSRNTLAISQGVYFILPLEILL